MSVASQSRERTREKLLRRKQPLTAGGYHRPGPNLGLIPPSGGGLFRPVDEKKPAGQFGGVTKYQRRKSKKEKEALLRRSKN